MLLLLMLVVLVLVLVLAAAASIARDWKLRRSGTLQILSACPRLSQLTISEKN